MGQADEARPALGEVDPAARPARRPSETGPVGLNIIAVAELNHFLEAEQAARSEVKQGPPGDLLEVAAATRSCRNGGCLPTSGCADSA